MNKPLPLPPREDDLVTGFDALNLAGKRPYILRKENDLVTGFDALALAGKKPPVPHKKLPDAPLPSGRPDRQDAFAANQHATTAILPSVARVLEPPSEQIPIHIPMSMTPTAKQSLTMQYALQSVKPDTPTKSAPAPALATLLQPHQDPILLPKETSKPALAPALATLLQPHQDPILLPKETSKPRLSTVTAPIKPATMVTPDRPRSISVTFPLGTSSPERSSAQCSGMTKSGKQCSRKVKLPATHSFLEPTPVLYCFQHKDTSQPGCYVRRVGIPDKFVEFSHYIPEYLQTDTQLALRVEMEKTTSTADEPGYIYTFEIRDPKRPDVIQLKVGRAVNLTKRLDQWDKQCGSKVQIPRGWWPGTMEGHDGAAGSFLKGNIKAGDPGPFCHRVERLVHIELSDLSLHAPYLNPGWPNNDTSDRSLSTSARSFSRRTFKCADCGVIHREIFAFPRAAEGHYKGQEWDLIVKPVIEKWGRFVKEHYSEQTVDGF